MINASFDWWCQAVNQDDCCDSGLWRRECVDCMGIDKPTVRLRWQLVALIVKQAMRHICLETMWGLCLWTRPMGTLEWGRNTNWAMEWHWQHAYSCYSQGYKLEALLYWLPLSPHVQMCVEKGHQLRSRAYGERLKSAQALSLLCHWPHCWICWQLQLRWSTVCWAWISCAGYWMLLNSNAMSLDLPWFSVTKWQN